MTTKAEMILKVVMAPHEPPSLYVEDYIKLVGDEEGITTLQVLTQLLDTHLSAHHHTHYLASVHAHTLYAHSMHARTTHKLRGRRAFTTPLQTILEMKGLKKA